MLLGEFAAELAGVGNGTVAKGELAGGEYEVAGADLGLIGSHGGGGLGQGKAEFGEFGFDAHAGEGRSFSSVKGRPFSTMVKGRPVTSVVIRSSTPIRNARRSMSDSGIRFGLVNARSSA